MYENPKRLEMDNLNIEHAPIIQHREVRPGSKITIWAEYEGTVCPCETGDVVRFPCLDRPRGEISDPVLETWTKDFGRIQYDTAADAIIEGVIGPSWVVPSNTCAPSLTSTGISCMTSEDHRIYSILSKRQCMHLQAETGQADENHTDVFHLPNSKLQGTLRETLRQKELVIYPGDTVVFIRPTLNSHLRHV